MSQSSAPSSPSSEKPHRRFIGPLLLLVGGVLAAVGLLDFVSALGESGGRPSKFGLLFLGVILLPIGYALTRSVPPRR